MVGVPCILVAGTDLYSVHPTVMMTGTQIREEPAVSSHDGIQGLRSGRAQNHQDTETTAGAKSV